MRCIVMRSTWRLATCYLGDHGNSTTALHTQGGTTHKLVKDGVLYKLLPMSKSLNDKAVLKEESKMLLIESSSARLMDAEMKSMGEVHIRVVKELPEEHKEEIPNEEKPILAKFKEVTPKELPDDLPPMRDIQRRIDLIPRKPLYPEFPISRSSFSQVGENDAELILINFWANLGQEKPKLYRPEPKKIKSKNI
ncbi:hypothetical protein CRG98_033812 [Punica granatum]|uniref:Uncharacterized protein n=1 Tax=Punica granatum TaxID=22663 RepID=A0A2I0IP81_PUNGR|nr:hypothetical protein CRG98_033812 [Punica granatum]